MANTKRKFHEFIIAMQEEASLYERIQKVLQEASDPVAAENIVRERYAEDFEAAMVRAKAAWQAWKDSV